MSLKCVIKIRSICSAGLLFGVVLASTLSGCSKGKAPWETAFPVSGVLTFKGRPVANADIALFPEDGSFPSTVRPKAKSAADGKFVVWTYAEGDGAPAGSYKVTVVHQEVGVSKDTIVAKPNDLPEKYSKVNTTDLKVQVVAGPNDIPPIDLR